MPSTRDLKADRARLLGEARALCAGAAAEGRDLSADEQATFTRTEAALDTLEGRIAAAEGEARARRDAEALRLYGPSAAPNGMPAAPDQLEACLRGDPEVRSWEGSFGSVRRTVDRRGRVEVRDLTVGTTTAGGHTVPTAVARLHEALVETSAVFRLNVAVLNTGDGAPLRIPRTDSYGTAAIAAEGSAIAESDPAFGAVELSSYKYGQLLQVSTELVQDTAVDLVGFVARQASIALDRAYGGHFMVGTGSGQPQGIVTSSGTGVTGGTGVGGSVTADELVDLQHSVTAPYRARGMWLMGDSTLGAVRQLKDSTNRYLFEASLAAGVPDQLLGSPLVTDPSVAALGTGAKSVVYGDFSGYYLRATPLRVERSDQYAFANDLVTFRALWRLDGRQVDTASYKAFRGGTA